MTETDEGIHVVAWPLEDRRRAHRHPAPGHRRFRPGRHRHDPRQRQGQLGGGGADGASVTATNLGTQFSRTATTDAEGQYALRLLPLGNYKLDVALSGFKNFAQTGIVLEVGRTARIDAVIEPGGVEEVVSIVGDAPLVETNSAALSRTVGQNEVLNLPLVNRDLYSLLSLTGGVTSNENSNSLGGPEQLTTINGSGRAQTGTVGFQLDGGNNTAGLRGTGNPAPEPGGRPGVPRHHEQLRRGVRPLSGGHRGRRHQVGNEPVPRRRLRVLPEREA